MKNLILLQYQEIIDLAAKRIAGISIPPEGWIRTMRKALGMSGAQLARRLGKTRSQVAQSEKGELTGSITLKSLDNLAQAMGCRVVYAIVPETSASALVAKRALEKAKGIVRKTDTHMALESQALNKKQRQFEVDRITRELIDEMPTDLWNDD